MKFVRPLFLSLALFACGGSISHLAATPNAPAAMAKISVERGPNDNTVGTLEVDHLAPPNSLSEHYSSYVAWVRKAGTDEWQNFGRLEVGEDRSASLDLTVPYSDFDLSVTAENDPAAQQRGGYVVLQGHVSR